MKRKLIAKRTAAAMASHKSALAQLPTGMDFISVRIHRNSPSSVVIITHTRHVSHQDSGAGNELFTNQLMNT